MANWIREATRAKGSRRGGGSRDGVEKVIFELHQQAKIVLGRVALGVEMGIRNLGVLRDHDESSACVEHTVLVL